MTGETGREVSVRRISGQGGSSKGKLLEKKCVGEGFVEKNGMEEGGRTEVGEDRKDEAFEG